MKTQKGVNQETRGSPFGSKLGPSTAENQRTNGKTTQNRAKRFNYIDLRLSIRDQGVGGSNPLSPTIYPKCHWITTDPVFGISTIWSDWVQLAAVLVSQLHCAHPRAPCGCSVRG